MHHMTFLQKSRAERVIENLSETIKSLGGYEANPNVIAARVADEDPSDAMHMIIKDAQWKCESALRDVYRILNHLKELEDAENNRQIVEDAV